MTDTPSAPVSAIEGLAISFYANRRRLLLVPAAILLLAAIAAVLVPVRYAVDAEVLLTLGPEYTFRPAAGAQSSVNQFLDRDQTMHTETAIIAGEDLHRATLRAVGVGRLYPKLMQPPGVVGRATAGVSDAIHEFLASLGMPRRAPAPAADPVELALGNFDAGLSSDVPKNGSIISVTFHHTDAEIGAEALNTLLGLYVQRRGELFRDEQSAGLSDQADAAQRTLREAEDRLAAFRLEHQVGGFEARREMALKRRGEMETDRADAQSQAAQLAARLDVVTRQLTAVAPELSASHDTDFDARLSPARTALAQVRGEYASALLRYGAAAPQLAALRARLDAAEADLAAGRRDVSPTTVRTSQNPIFSGLQDDRLKTETSLAVQRARLNQDDLHLAALTTDLGGLEQSEQELGRLDLRRAVAEEAWRTATKTLADRRIAEAVEAARRPTVRIVQPAVPPLAPAPIRRTILAAGAVLSLVGLAAATLIAHAFASTYWRPEDIEADLGIAVIAVIAEAPAALPRRRGGGGRTLLAAGP